MTRINVGIKPKQLTDEHLLAEHREIKRLPAFFKKRLEKGKFDDIPDKFTLGEGHMCFFLDKPFLTYMRYMYLWWECIDRHFLPTDYRRNWDIYDEGMGVCAKYHNDYVPTTEDIYLIKERITERITNSPKKVWHYYGKPISKEEAIKLLYK